LHGCLREKRPDRQNNNPPRKPIHREKSTRTSASSKCPFSTGPTILETVPDLSKLAARSER
jgi:hypothetical protein